MFIKIVSALLLLLQSFAIEWTESLLMCLSYYEHFLVNCTIKKIEDV